MRQSYFVSYQIGPAPFTGFGSCQVVSPRKVTSWEDMEGLREAVTKLVSAVPPYSYGGVTPNVVILNWIHLPDGDTPPVESAPAGNRVVGTFQVTLEDGPLLEAVQAGDFPAGYPVTVELGLGDGFLHAALVSLETTDTPEDLRTPR